MFDHVTIRASDRGASEQFYDTVLASIGVERSGADELFTEWGDFEFSVGQADGEVGVTRGLHVGFVASSRDAVDTFWRTGTEAGYRSDGEPGPRPEYSAEYYGGFLLDPDGNSIEAVHRGDMRHSGVVDHVWIRVADVAASRRFYELVGEQAGFELGYDSPERARFGGADGSFSVVAGTPTEHVHMAFPSASDEAVAGFHAALTAAGYRDNGPPGERPIYHPGYYGAFVLDPDGNNVELVNHGDPS
jgi:catechol 2,3-dioxygenase-like lactoylglutathione lyase family enzyme